MWVTASLRAGGLRDTKPGLGAAGWIPGGIRQPRSADDEVAQRLSRFNMSLFNKV